MFDKTIARHEETSQAPFVYLSTHFVQAKEYFEAIVTSTSDAICTTDMQGRIQYFSPGAERMFGHLMVKILGTPAAEFYKDGLAEAQRIMKMLLSCGSLSDHETVVKISGGRRLPISLSAALLKNRRGSLIGTLGISKDISRRVELENQLRELSITDSLTGLYNQRHCLDRISSEMRRARRQKQKLSLILIDLDHFKQVNDQWGHLEGDRILKETSGILRSSIRQEVDEAFRYGGDEFVVLLPGIGAVEAARIAARIHHAASQKFYGKWVGLSLGCAALRSADSVSLLIARADQNMYLAKRRARKRSRQASFA